MKKGRHRRFEEARALKRGPDIDIEGILNEPSLGESSLDDDEKVDDDEDDYDDYESGSWTNPEVD